MNRDKFRKAFFQIFVSLGILTTLGYYLYVNSDKYLHLLNISPSSALLLIILSFTFPVINGMQNAYLYRDMGLLNITHWESFLITAASTLVNQLPVPGGILSRGYYLKLRHGLSYTKYASSTVALFFCYLAINGLVGFFALLYRRFIEGGDAPVVLFAAFILMTLSALLFFIPFQKFNLPESLRIRSVHLIDGWVIISQNPLLIVRLTVLQVVLVLLLSIRYWIAFRMVSQAVTFGQALLFASASILTQLISIAPGGLGVREAIVAGVGQALGFDVAFSVLAVGLDRLFFTMMVLLIGWVSILILGRNLGDSTDPNNKG